MSDNPTNTVSTRLGTPGTNIIVEVGNAAMETVYRTRISDNSQIQVSVNVNINNNVSVYITESYNSTNQGSAATSPPRFIPPAPRARPAIYSTAANLLGFLPGVGLDALPDDTKNCIVCHEDFAGQDLPVQLPCNHVVGRQCIKEWILGGHHTCPMCRQAIFKPDEGTIAMDWGENPAS